MSQIANYHGFRAMLLPIALLWLSLQMTGCASDSYTAKGAKKGAARGALAGAVGGLVSGLVFGGDPVERAAQGAVYGGTTGAVVGAISGSEADKRVQQQREASLAKLRQNIGDDAFEGLAALAKCQHDASLRQAAKAQQSENPNFVLAGLWLEVLSYADRREEERARSLFATIVEKDWDIKNKSQVEATMRKTLNDLMDIRQEYKLPRVCK